MAENKISNFYETVFIVDLSKGEDTVKATVDKFTSLISENGEIIEVKDKAPHWGKRRLAYAINDLNEGYYVVVTFKSEAEFPNELYRLMNIDENVMRSIVIKLDYEPKATPEEAPAEEDAVVEVEETVVVEEAPANEEAVADTAADATVSE